MPPVLEVEEQGNPDQAQRQGGALVRVQGRYFIGSGFRVGIHRVEEQRGVAGNSKQRRE